MLLETDPLRDLDRLTRAVLGTSRRPVMKPMDAWRAGETCVVEFDVPGMQPDSLDLNVERNGHTRHAIDA